MKPVSPDTTAAVMLGTTSASEAQVIQRGRRSSTPAICVTTKAVARARNTSKVVMNAARPTQRTRSNVVVLSCPFATSRQEMTGSTPQAIRQPSSMIGSMK